MGSHYGDWNGKTIETPGMVRWYNDSHYFLKRRNPESKRFVLGLENRFGQDGAYEYSTSIEFDNNEAPDLMDRIAKFNGLPTYTELTKTREALEHIIGRLAGPMYSSGVSKGAILRELNMALNGETVE